jgi:hypothetical protein
MQFIPFPIDQNQPKVVTSRMQQRLCGFEGFVADSHTWWLPEMFLSNLKILADMCSF